MPKLVPLILIGVLESSIAVGLSAAQAAKSAAQRGVVVEEVGEGSALAKAGVKPEDVLLSWRRLRSPPANPEEARGRFESAFDWKWLVVEQAPRGVVEFMGRRNGEEQMFTIAQGLWEAEVRPWMPAGLLDDYLRGRELVEAKELAKGVRFWEKAAGVADRHLRSWLWLRLGEVWSEEREWDRSQAAYRLALQDVQEPSALGFIWWAIGEDFKSQDQLESARHAYSMTHRIRKNEWGAETLALAKSLQGMGAVAYYREDLHLATDLLRRALHIRQKLAPASLDVAHSLESMGILAWDRGDLDEAVGSHQQALDIREELAPGSLEVAHSLDNLGLLAISRGNLEQATEQFRSALEIRQELEPDSLNSAYTLNNLGVVAWQRADLDRAADLFQRAFTIRQKLAPGSALTADSLNSLGGVAWRRGDLEEAADLHQRALEIREKLAPNGISVARSLNNLGDVARDAGNLRQAEDFYQRAIEIKQRLIPGSLDLASSLHSFGTAIWKQGDLKHAIKIYQRALEIQESLAPGSIELANTLHALGVLHRQETPAQYSTAVDYLLRSLDVLENQLSRFGGSHDIRGTFRALYTEYYRVALEVQLELSRLESAFHTLERSRARSFLEHFAERDSVFTEAIAEDLKRERRLLAGRFDRIQQQLNRINHQDNDEEIEELRDQLRRLRDEAREIEGEIRRTSPKLAALQYPQPLDVASFRMALDPGTLVLSYSVGEESTILFVVSVDALRVETLAITDKKLRKRVGELDRQIRRVRQHGSQRMRRFEEVARDLYGTLIEPIAADVAASERLLILGDGPLHYLPWSALIRDTSEGSQYLVEWKPIHQALSATVFAELKKLRRKDSERPPPIQIAAFGDPNYPGREAAEGRHGDLVVRSAMERCSFDFDALPYSRYEIDSIAGNFPADQTRVYLGEQATEERVKAIGRDAQIVHIAAHGCMDERFPLNSFVALAVPEKDQEDRDNGLLQAWEIFERVRLDADLVVLSACETALGEERGGEGLYGLTRAFQYAGARTVAASLWKVSDRATAGLMSRFYKHLRQGKSKDQALRVAQLELLRGPILVPGENGEEQEIVASAPYYWAGFQIYGDWQ